jgi:hypothetical protein
MGMMIFFSLPLRANGIPEISMSGFLKGVVQQKRAYGLIQNRSDQLLIKDLKAYSKIKIGFVVW